VFGCRISPRFRILECPMKRRDNDASRSLETFRIPLRNQFAILIE
jgi:hypothetical protein